MMLSYYKRLCNRCFKKIDIQCMVTIKKGKIHLCRRCAGEILRNSKNLRMWDKSSIYIRR